MPLITDAIGRVLGKRYRIVAPLGVGASAQVFLAEDVTLRRQVAVKVLQPGLAQSEAFLRRFGAEARAAAALNHPNLARVFDWGEDEGGPYLVLEYLSGGSLLDLFQRGVRLSVAQAASIGAQAARGLAYAHARGLVHRDVKPANLLFDDEGRVRIADFGVARALADAAWTEPVGTMVGTARYAAPEQAQGFALDGRADVYALSLVLFEGLTGYVPFALDTPIGTLAARIGATLPAHGALGPLEPVLRSGAAPVVADRPDAATFAASLESVAATLPRAEPLPLAASGSVTVGPPTAAAAVMSSTAVLQPAVPTAAPAVPAGPVQLFDLDAVDGARPGTETKERRRRRWWPALVGLAVLALVGGILAAINTGLFTPSTQVPYLVGLNQAATRAALDGQHLAYAHGTPVFSTKVGKGEVVSQNPKAKTVLKQGSTVSVVFSKGPPIETVPSLLGLDCAGATRVLGLVHLLGSCPDTAQAYSDNVATGQVISWANGAQQDPTRAPYGAAIVITISKGLAPKVVPSLQGQSYAAAQAALQALGLSAQEIMAPSATTPAGQVDHTVPAAGTSVPANSSVTVVVSTGPPTAAVPQLVGSSVAQATTALQNVGLKVGSVYGPAKGTVILSDPPAGQTVDVGSSVNLYTK
jgi:eukaryotic-like serine/threonine-protein kinase